MQPIDTMNLHHFYKKEGPQEDKKQASSIKKFKKETQQAHQN